MALAIGVAARCDGCLTFHTHDALRAGATEEVRLHQRRIGEDIDTYSLGERVTRNITHSP
jgi:AhpD family alkylhydroperoxidase